jgi:hypothetical protein
MEENLERKKFEARKEKVDTQFVSFQNFRGVWAKQYYFYVVISFFLILMNTISASEPHESETDLFQKGLELAKNRKWLEAINCFKPLAEQTFNPPEDRAIPAHNLALCYFQSGNEFEAYHWFQVARAVTAYRFEPSRRSLERMNLLFLLLPYEVLTNIVSYFTMQDLSRFNTVSLRANRAVILAVTHTNFITSKSPYARQFIWRLREVQFVMQDDQFDPLSIQLRLVQQAKVTNGSIEVHFRDPKHLRDIVERIPRIEVKERLYFVHDRNAKDFEELVPTEGDIEIGYFFYFTAKFPVRVTGVIPDELPYPIYFSKPVEQYKLSLGCKGGISSGNLRSYTGAHYLSSALEKFNNQLLVERTADVYQLLEDRKTSRQQESWKYPSFFDLCPNVCVISGSEVEMTHTDIVCAKKPFIYIAKSIPEITDLQNRLQDFTLSISFIDPECSQSGVYCDDPLDLKRGFDIFTHSDLTLSGTINLPDHFLTLRTNGNFWCWTLNLHAEAFFIRSKKSFNAGPHSRILEENIKPSDMSTSDWEKLLDYWSQSGFF